MSYGYSQELITDLRRQFKDAQALGTECLAARDKALATAREEAGYAEGHLQRATELRTLLRDHVDAGNADQYADPATPAASPRRREFLDGLRKLLEFYELHPDLPTPHSADLNVFPDGRGDDEQEIAQVARMASALGIAARRPKPNFHFRAEIKFSEAVDLSFVSTALTDKDWKPGDELPQWFLHEQATYAPAAPADGCCEHDADCVERRTGESVKAGDPA